MTTAEAAREMVNILVTAARIERDHNIPINGILNVAREIVEYETGEENDA